MDYEIKQKKLRSLCLECGNVIRYGRTDKRYCSDECKNRHHNHLAKAGRSYKAKVLKALEKNYAILDDLLKSGADSADLAGLMAVGFVPGVVTSYLKNGKHDVYTCYDIKYIMTPTRIYSMEKIRKL